MDARDSDPADPTDPAEKWPLPPSWMWSCQECTDLYKAMKQAPEVVDAARATSEPGVDCDPFDTIVSSQIHLARHIATHHTSEVPAMDQGCDRCKSDMTRQMPVVLVLEHRARHVFAPPSIAGLL